MKLISPIAEQRRLEYACRRGTRELETLVRGFLDNHYEFASTEQKSIFRWLLSMEDDKLWDWIYLWGQSAVDNKNQKTTNHQVQQAIDDYIQTREFPLSGLEPESKA